MMQAFTWDLQSLKKQCGNIRWGYVLSPKVNQRATWACTQAVLVSAKTRHPEAAWQLCQALFSPEFQTATAPIGMPTDLKIAGELAATGQAQYDHLPTLLAAVGTYRIMPRAAHLSEAEHLFGNAQESVWSGRMSPLEAVQRAAREINRMIQEQRQYGS